jgi:hypothetical protein
MNIEDSHSFKVKATALTKSGTGMAERLQFVCENCNKTVEAWLMVINTTSTALARSNDKSWKCNSGRWYDLCGDADGRLKYKLV